MTKRQPRVETPDEESPVVSSDVEEVPIPQRNPQSRPRPKPRPKAKPVSRPRSPEVHIGSDGGEVEAQSPRSMGLKRLGKRKPQPIESSSEAPGKVPPEKGSTQQVGNEPSGSVITARKKRKLGGGLATSYAPPSFTSYDVCHLFLVDALTYCCAPSQCLPICRPPQLLLLLGQSGSGQRSGMKNINPKVVDLSDGKCGCAYSCILSSIHTIKRRALHAISLS